MWVPRLPVAVQQLIKFGRIHLFDEPFELAVVAAIVWVMVRILLAAYWRMKVPSSRVSRAFAGSQNHMLGVLRVVYNALGRRRDVRNVGFRAGPSSGTPGLGKHRVRIAGGPSRVQRDGQRSPSAISRRFAAGSLK